MVGRESPCIIKHWSMIPLAYYCTLGTDSKGQWKGLLNMVIGIVPFNEGSRIRIEILYLYRDFYFIFKAAFGREDIESNVADYCTTHSRPGSVPQSTGSHASLGIFFVFLVNRKWKTMAWDLGFMRKSSGVCIILLFSERPSWITYR